MLPDAFAVPSSLDVSFKGFSHESFAVLDRLRANPHVGKVREEKAALDAHVVRPFRAYRDDLVVNGVLPNRLPFETERGVFSRILKNDFGAGGAHHHLWMAFYRPPLRRLTDVQLSHSLYPDRFVWGLFAGEYAGPLFRALRDRMRAEPGPTLGLLNGLLRRGYTLAYAPHLTKSDDRIEHAEPLDALPPEMARAKAFWVRRSLPRETVLTLGPGLVAEALAAQAELWPLYRWWAEAAGPVGPPMGMPAGEGSGAGPPL